MKTFLRLKNRLFCILLIVVATHLFLGSQVFAKRVILPLTLDYQLLTSLLINSGFVGDDLDALITGTKRDCVHIRISQPQYSTAKNGLMRLQMKLFVRLGTPFNEQCIGPAEWQGYLVLYQKPVFNGEKFSLSFKTVDSSLYDLNQQPAQIAGFLWQFAKPHVFSYLDRITFDLAPPLVELRHFLEPLFNRSIQKQMRQTLGSLQGGNAIVYSAGIVLELLAEVPDITENENPTIEQRLTEEERKEAIKLWEKWDALLVQLLTSIAAQPLATEDQTVLLDVLLGIRHGFVNLLGQNNLPRDLVRTQFVWAWQKLAPLFRKQLYSQPSDNILGYFAFFTAVDAMTVFDRAGPSFGLEISEQGLLRLLRMLKGDGFRLHYTPQQDDRLREILQLPKMMENEKDVPNGEGIALPQEAPLGFFFDFIVKPLHANDQKKIPSFREILSWKVSKKNLNQYTQRVRSVLRIESEKVLAMKTIPKSLHTMYRELIPAIAWQESCFRQFAVKNKKFTYLLSYNRTSVGLMQINERVWRGFYNRDLLRWDIRYNALAGCEIIDLYLRRYVLKKAGREKNSSPKKLSQLLYAMYNGGPSQLEKFQERARSGKLYQSDKLFLEKYQWVKGGRWDQLKICLVGG